MKSRGCSLIFLSLTLAGNANMVYAQESAVQVQLYDYTGLSPADVRALTELAEKIVANAGISIDIDTCAKAAIPCEGRSKSPKQIVLRVIPDSSKSMKSLRREKLGTSVADRDGGTYGTVFLKPAEQRASDASLPRTVVLAYAMAHEIGHLLLGEAHSPQGLMKATWDEKDFLAMAQNGLRFSREESQKLISRYRVPRPAESDTHTTVAITR